jgi:hypothetical protein
MLRESIKQVIDLLSITLKSSFLAEIKAFREIACQIIDKTQEKEVSAYWNAKIIGSSWSKFKSINRMFDTLNIDIQTYSDNAKHSLDFSGVYNTFYIKVYKPVLEANKGILNQEAIDFLLKEFSLYCQDRKFYADRLKAIKEAEKKKNLDKIEAENTAKIPDEKAESIQTPPTLDKLTSQELMILALNCYKLMDNNHKANFRDWLDEVDNVNYQTMKETGTDN